MNRTPMTVRGAQALREELARLKKQERPSIVQAIAEARAHGDLRENAEYHAAKERQGFIEGRISEIESALAFAQIIDPGSVNAGGRVVFGATVEIYNTETEEEISYQIVGELEADIRAGLLSISSPVARALIGQREGDVVVVETPRGQTEYEIVSVRYADRV